ncbi:MAG: excinuclease ATPase subunit [Pseudomonadales bacterium]
MTTTFAMLLVVSLAANARDDHVQFPVSDAMQTSDARNQLTGEVKFFFGDESHPDVATRFGTFTSNKKTNAFMKSEKEACERAFLSAMIQFQQRAMSEGGDAVIGLRSIYRGNNLDSSTDYICGAGNIMAGVTFEGTVVKLAN